MVSPLIPPARLTIWTLPHPVQARLAVMNVTPLTVVIVPPLNAPANSVVPPVAVITIEPLVNAPPLIAPVLNTTEPAFITRNTGRDFRS